MTRAGLVPRLGAEEDAGPGRADCPPESNEEVTQPDHDLRGKRQLHIHRREHRFESGNDEDQQDDNRTSGDRENHDRIDHRSFHFSDDRVVLLQKHGEPEEDGVENTARLARRNHVDEEIAEHVGVLGQRVGKCVTALHVIHNQLRRVREDLVFCLLA